MCACKVVVMGVAGCGKSAAGAALAAELGALWQDGDDLHPKANVDKMRAGEPLDDADRAPWLAAVGDWLAGPGARVAACSALRRRYRDLLRGRAGDGVIFVHLSGDRKVIARRMAARDGHFMPPSLMDSQFAALQPLGPDERGFRIDVEATLEAVVAAAREGIARLTDGASRRRTTGDAALP